MQKIILSTLLLFGLSSTASVEDDFTLLELKVQHKKMDVGQVFIGGDYFVKASFSTADKSTVKSIIPTCACIQVLESRAAGNGKIDLSLSLRTVRKRKFKFYLDITLTNGFKDRLMVIGESIPGSDDYINPQLLVAKKSVSRELYVSANRLIGRSADYFIADLRNPADFLRSRIPESRNVRFVDLQTNESLKKQTIILVGEAFYSDILETQCGKLRKLGYKKSFILLGGLDHWHKSGGQLTGVEKPQVRSHLTPRQAFVASRFKETVFVAEKDSSENLFPNFKKVDDILVRPDTPFEHVICLTASAYETLKDKSLNISLLAAGPAAYKDYLLKHSALSSPSAVLQRRKISDCVGCP